MKAMEWNDAMARDNGMATDKWMEAMQSMDGTRKQYQQ